LPPLRITTPAGGGISYLTWLDLPTNFQPVRDITDTIFPVQEMLPFQRRWRYFVSSPTIAATKALVWRVTCPISESWRMDQVVVSHDHSTLLETRISLFAADGLDAIGQIFRRKIDEDHETLLYPVRANEATTTGSDQFENTASQLIILPRETFEINVESHSVGEVTFKIRIRYELIPVPADNPRLSAVAPVITTP